MLQFNKQYIENENYMTNLINSALTVISRRQALYDKLTKKDGVPIERYITTTGTSYFAGKEPVISVKQEKDEKKISLIKKLFDKVVGNGDSAEEYKLLLDYINDYNDLPNFFYELAKDYFGLGACYWLNYETQNNEQVFAKVSALQCVGLYDYSTPVQLVAGLRVYPEKDANGNLQNIAELILPNEKRYYVNNVRKPDYYKEDISKREKINWYLPPFYAIENPDGLSLAEPVEDLIQKLEQIIRNESNTFQYNDDAKLKITGYEPQNPLMNEDGTPNQDRIKEDSAVLNAKVFYTPSNDGDIDWIIKNVNDTAIQNYTKTLIDFIFMLAFIPNMNDISFTNSDSGKAIEQKFFGLEQVLIEAEKLFKKELLRMYENITARINVKKNTKYDFRDINIKLNRNLPVAKEDITNMWLGLRDLISDATIIENLPLELDANSELSKKKEESEENMEDAMNKAKSFSKGENNVLQEIKEEEKEVETTEEVGE